MKLTALMVAPLIATLAMSNTTAAQQHRHDADEHAQETTGHSHESATAHGGTVTMTKEFHFEVAFHRNQVTVYAYDSKQAAIDPKNVAGNVKIEFRDRDRKPLMASLRYAGAKAEEEDGHGHEEAGHDEHGAIGHLVATLDLSKVLEGDAKATFSLSELPGKSEQEVEFKETFRLARLSEFVCPMKCTEPLDESGKCAKCEMELKKVDYIYQCPMHSKVTARKNGEACWICGMTLAKGPDIDEGTKAEGKKHDEHKKHNHE